MPLKPLLELAALLGGEGAQSLIEEVEQAGGDLAWRALIDGLVARRLMAEIDWKASAEEVMDSLLPLAAGKRRAPWKAYLRACAALDPAGEPMASAYLDLAGDVLRKRGLALVYLELSGDSSPVMVLPAAEVERALSLARAAGLGEIVEMKTRPAAPPPRLEIPAAPPGTPALRIAGTVVVNAPRSAARGFFALPGDRAVMLTAWGADRRWYLWFLSPGGATGQPVDAGLFPSWSALPAVEHFCALFRSGERFGLMSNDEVRLWESVEAAPRLGRVTPPLLRAAHRRAPNVSFGGASDDPGVVVVAYFAVGSLQASPFLARLALAETTGGGPELRHTWLENGAPIVPWRRPPPAEGARPRELATLTAVAHARGSTFVVSPVRGAGRMAFASVARDGEAEILFELPAQGQLAPTSGGDLLAVTEETPPGVRRALYAPHAPPGGGYAFPFDPDSLPPNLRLQDRQGDTWWALDVEAEAIRLHLGRIQR